MRMTPAAPVLAAPAYHGSDDTERAPATASPNDEGSLDKIDDAPYFADGVLARARATQARLEAVNYAKVNEPIVFAKAICEVYEKQELVQIVKKSLVEIGKIKGHPVIYRFRGIELMLTSEGFRDRSGDAVDKKLGLGDYKTAAAARQQVDAQLVQLADSPDTMVEFQPLHMRREDSSSSVCEAGPHFAVEGRSKQLSRRPQANRKKHSGLLMRAAGHLPIMGRLFR